MSHITDVDRTVFAEANHTALDNFTDDEQKQLHTIAVQLRAIIEAAKKRGVGGFQSPGFSKGFQTLKRGEQSASGQCY